jgi:hypothetical protein
MTIKALIILCFLVSPFYFRFIDWIFTKIQDHIFYKQRLLDDNVELAKMIKGKSGNEN